MFYQTTIFSIKIFYHAAMLNKNGCLKFYHGNVSENKTILSPRVQKHYSSVYNKLYEYEKWKAPVQLFENLNVIRDRVQFKS